MDKDIELRQEEKRLYETLYEILDYYNYQRISFDPSDISAQTVISSIKKNIYRCGIEKRIDILEKIITKVNYGILSSDGTRFIFHDAIDQSLREKASKKKVKKVVSKNEEMILKQKEDDLLQKISYCIDKFEVADRKMLLDLETDINKRIMRVIGTFGKSVASTNSDIVSRLNQGMYGKNQAQLISELESCGIKVTKSNKLKGVMSDDLLRYRLTALYLMLDLCKERMDLIRPKTIDDNYSIGEYTKLLKEVKFIGKTVASAFEAKYGITTRESLIQDTYDKKYEQMLGNSQIMLDELLDSDDVTIKSIRRDKK